MDDPTVGSIPDALHLSAVVFDERQVLSAGCLRRATRGAGFSVGDRAGLAIAKSNDRFALIAHRSWERPGATIGFCIETSR